MCVRADSFVWGYKTLPRIENDVSAKLEIFWSFCHNREMKLCWIFDFATEFVECEIVEKSSRAHLHIINANVNTLWCIVHTNDDFKCVNFDLFFFSFGILPSRKIWKALLPQPSPSPGLYTKKRKTSILTNSKITSIAIGSSIPRQDLGIIASFNFVELRHNLTTALMSHTR